MTINNSVTPINNRDYHLQARGGLNFKKVFVSPRGDLAAITHQGARDQNQDGFMILTIGPRKLLALADGMGGHAGGREASQLALDQFAAAIKAGISPESALAIAHKKILEVSREYFKQAEMGSTFVVADISGHKADIYSCGDSRIFQVKANGDIFLLTPDQSWASDAYPVRPEAFPLSNPLAYYEHIRLYENLNPLLSVLGHRLTISKLTILLENSDRLLLCSDGLHGFLPYDRFVNIIRELNNPPATVAALFKETLAVMAQEEEGDNITIVLYEHRG